MRQRIVSFILLLYLGTATAEAQNIGINEDGSTPNSSAILDIKANDKGLLIPRLTSSQRINDISNPADGLMVYDTDLDQFMYFDSGTWYSVSNDRQWEESGQNIFRSAGNVGIGTNSPANLLHLKKGVLGPVGIQFEGKEITTSSAMAQNTSASGQNVNGSTLGSWIGTPTSVAATNGAYFTGPIASDNQYSDYLRVSFPSFSTGTVPAGAVISGVRIDIRRRASDNNDIRDRTIRISGGQNRAVSSYWNTSWQTVTYGGTGDAWGTTVTPSLVNAGNFYVDIQYEKDNELFGNTSEQGFVDYVRAYLYLNLPSGEATSIWSAGTYDGEFRVKNSPSLNGTADFKVGQDGVTELQGFRMSSGASVGRVLTSSADGTATWQLPQSDGDASVSNEIQSLSFSGNSLSLSSANTVNLSTLVNDADADPGNELQTIQKAGSVVTLSNGGGSFTDAVNDADASSTNEIQDLSLSGNTLSLSGDASSVDLSPLVGDDGDWTLVGSDVHTMGNVGVGLSDPEAELEVQGTIRTDGYNVEDIEIVKSGYYMEGGNLTMSRSKLTSNGTRLAPSVGMRLGELAFRGQTSTNVIGISTPLTYEIGATIASEVEGHFNTDQSANLIFSTKPAGGIIEERLRINSDGNVGIAISSPLYRLHLPNSVDGEGRAYAWSTYSDGRIKKNIHEIEYGLDEVIALRPMSYVQMNSEFKEGRLVVIEERSSENIGFIAQDLGEIIPEAVIPPKDESTELWGVDYTRLIPVLTKAIQEQQDQIDVLKKELEELKLGQQMKQANSAKK